MFIYDYPWHLVGRHAQKHVWPTAVPPSFVGFQPSGPFSKLADALSATEARRADVLRRLPGVKIEINLTRDGVRQIMTGRRIWKSGATPSYKAGQPIHWEGPNEPAFVEHSNIDVGVLDFRSQPVKIQLPVGDTMRSYIPDFMRLLRTGDVEIVEVKSNPKSIGDDAYRAKLEAAQSVCAAIGWKFRIVFGDELRADTIFNWHVSRIHRDRRATVPAGFLTHVERLISGGGGIACLGAVIDAAGGGVIGRAATCALIHRGRIYFDLSQPLSAETAVLSTREG